MARLFSILSIILGLIVVLLGISFSTIILFVGIAWTLLGIVLLFKRGEELDLDKMLSEEKTKLRRLDRSAKRLESIRYK